MENTNDFHFIKIPCVFVETFARENITGREFSLIMALSRKTFGWDKLEDKISHSQWQKETGLSLSTIKHCLKRLVEKKVFTKKPGNIIAWGWNNRLWGGVKPLTDKPLTGTKVYTGGVKPLYSKGVKPLTPQQILTTDTITTEREKEIKNQISEIYNHWNSLSLIKHREMTAKMKSAINSKLKNCSISEIKKAMDNYKEAQRPEHTQWTWDGWTIDQFLQRGFERFLQYNFHKGDSNGPDDNKVPEFMP